MPPDTPHTPAADDQAPPRAGVDSSPASRSASDAEPSTGAGSQPVPQSQSEGRASRPSVHYDVPESYRYLDDVHGPPPVQSPGDGRLRHVSVREDQYPDADSRLGQGSLPAGFEPLASQRSRRVSAASAIEREVRMARRRSTTTQVDYDVPDRYANLAELAVSPVQNPDESPIYQHHSLEEVRSRDQEYPTERRLPLTESLVGARAPVVPEIPLVQDRDQAAPTQVHVSRLATQVYTTSYLVFFALLGTLARLGLQALTAYPGAPITFSSVWPNFAGSLFIGFLAEDRMLFRFEWGLPPYENQLRQPKEGGRDEESGSGSARLDRSSPAQPVAKKAHLDAKKTIPLYIGLATGFCGSFTSFSAFVRDMFLALSDDLPLPGVAGTLSRSGGDSFMALVAVLLGTVALSLSGLFIGAHLAIALEPVTPTLPYLFTRRVLDRSVLVLGWGCWLGAVVLSIIPPDRDVKPGAEIWRGRATTALAFAPLGCLVRFYASLQLNGRIGAFPLGTFVVNVVGTAVLAMCWDVAHAGIGGVIGCQVLQGLEDGFCGCLTTVSTWVAELAALRRRHAYVYGAASVLVSLAAAVAIMGGLRWSDGFSSLLCVH